MRARRLLCAVMAAALALPIVASAQTASCPDDKATAALDASEQLKSWQQVMDYRARYQACDDGAIAEGISDSVVHLLADQWATLPTLASAASRDRGLVPFVLHHIDSTVGDKEIETIIRKSKTACPAGNAALCRALYAKSRQALQEMTSGN